jgi:hypothetical protein
MTMGNTLAMGDTHDEQQLTMGSTHEKGNTQDG